MPKSATGQTRSLADVRHTSVLPPITVDERTSHEVAVVPLSDIRIVERMTVFSGEALEIRPALRLDSRGLSPLNQRTSIFACRAKRLIARDRRYDLVVVPRPVRFGRRL